MDLTFQVPMQYCSLQHLNLLLSPVPSTTGCFIWFASISFYYARATLFACLRRDLTLPFSIHKPTVTVTDLVFIFEASLPKLVSLPLRKGDQMLPSDIINLRKNANPAMTNVACDISMLLSSRLWNGQTIRRVQPNLLTGIACSGNHLNKGLNLFQIRRVEIQ